MTEREIRTLLEKPYDREHWKQLVTALFPGRDVFARPVEQQATTVQGRKQVKHMLQFGDVQLADGNLVALFEVEVMPGVDLTRNRVAVRKAIEQPVKQGGHSGALIAFVDPSQGLWRFSFYSNTLKEDGAWDANNPKRYTYLLGQGEKCLTAARQFEALSTKRSGATLQDLLEAFSVEKVSKAFFREYKEHYQHFVEHLTGKRMVRLKGKWVEKKTGEPSPKLAAYFNGNEKDARDFCKKLMGRVVFLYFLQKKRWLGASSTEYADGYADFVNRLFRAQGDETFYPNVLVPLFFDTLNTERPNDDYRMPDGSIRKVPFLNGGLFDKDALDSRTQLLTFPPALFSKPDEAEDPDKRGFLDFLNAYNFTVHEAGPEEQTLAVDPEMLGHIFENLLEDNKDKGAFYTPKEIVHYMCQESLTQYLKNYLGRSHSSPRAGIAQSLPADLEDQLRRFLKDGTGAGLSRYSGLLLKALHEVKVCDPAIGSGAFPMGILHEIFQAVYHLQEFSPDEFSSTWGVEEWEPAEVKLRIIQHSIYGVDIERGAVDIARLRFWLSIIVDEPRPRTLPNLDYKIVVGDSLLGKFNGEVLEIDWDLKGSTDRVNEVRAAIDALHAKTELYFRDQPKAKKEKLVQEIRALKIELLSKQLELNRDKFKARMLSVGRIGDLTKKEMVKATEQKLQLAAYEETLGNLRALAKQKDKPLEYFDWQLDFPEVLNANVTKDPGFDIVIGNPPYVRQESITTLKEHLARRYQATYDSAGDLYVSFIQLGHEIIRQGGVFCYIVGDKWIRAGYGEKLRAYLAQRRILSILDFGELPVFEATAYTCILLTRNTRPLPADVLDTILFRELPSDLFASLRANGTKRVQAEFVAKDYLIGTATELAAWTQLQSVGVSLADYLGKGVFRGLLTGLNGAFVIPEEDAVELERQHSSSTDVLQPFIEGKDVQRYARITTRKRLILFERGKTKELLGTGLDEPAALRAMVKRYPAVFNHLTPFAEKARARDDQGEYWWELRACVYYDAFKKPKIVYQKFQIHPAFTLDESGAYCNDATWFIPARDLYLLGVLNSKVGWQLIALYCTAIQNGYQLIWDYMRKVRIAQAGYGVRSRIEQLVQKRIEQVEGPKATALEREIDVLVCKLYGLSWEQAKVVDPELGLSKEAYEAIELPDPGSEPGMTGSGGMVSEPGAEYLSDHGTLFGQVVEEPPTPKRTAGPPSTPVSGNGEASAVILQYLKARPGWHGKSAILEGSGADAKAWNAAIKELLEAGKVERQGEKKGARYRGRG